MTDDPFKDATSRCSSFINDFIEICRKHRVLIRLDEPDFSEEPYFEEFSICPSGHGWTLGIGDLENSVRLALWDDIHGA
jgi:hypothetical protein|tara:strand:- start:6397 stop:6633 length:237 start_codon:yes stop_codon:yes gene_type:complete